MSFLFGIVIFEKELSSSVFFWLNFLFFCLLYSFSKSLNNDLQAAACSLRPALRLILDTGNEYGALGGIVSGSGPSVAFLVADEDHSLDLAVALTSSGVVGSVARAQGPVPGAKVISVN